jgi:pimeloyl-ACP methyl ester carboxylesterase
VLALAPRSPVLAFDYRGYGFSTGTPTVGTLLPDCERFAAALPDLLRSKQLAGSPLVVYGRSLGAACAIHIVSLAPVRRVAAPHPSAAARACAPILPRPGSADDERNSLLNSARRHLACLATSTSEAKC